MLHMKAGSVLALRPDFFVDAPRHAYSRDLSERDWSARLLASPESVYGERWDSGPAAIEHVVVIVREAPGWAPPCRKDEVARLLKGGGHRETFHHQAFFNGSLILITAGDELRETRRYQRLLDRTAVSWINNCGSPEELAESFIRAVMAQEAASRA